MTIEQLSAKFQDFSWFIQENPDEKKHMFTILNEISSLVYKNLVKVSQSNLSVK